jgi:hypothetical protein
MAAAAPTQAAAAVGYASPKTGTQGFCSSFKLTRKEIAALTKTEQDSRQRCRLQRFAV